MSTKYQIDLLKKLIKIYERRALQNSDFKQAVNININEKDFPLFFNYQEDYNEAIKQLLKDEIINVRYVRYTDDFSRIDLNLDNIDKAYKLLKRKNINVIIKEFENEFFSFNNDTIETIQNDYLRKKQEKRSIKSYLKDSFIDTIKAIYYIELNEEEIYERNFSVKVFNDSKRFESLKPMILSYYNDNKLIFEKYQITKKPTYLYLKGKGIVTINNQKINLSNIKTSMGISINEDLFISFENILQVITIENETTFHHYEDDKSLIIYLAGYSNTHKINVLNKIQEHNIDLYHYGDIDFGGFNILADLRKRVNENVKAFNMDLKTLIKYKRNQIIIKDKTYIENLKTLLNNSLLEDCYEVIQYMIDNNVKLEQESII